jgi:hypothetical protein
VAVDGLPDGWWSVAPQTLHLMPFGSNGSSEQDVTVTVHPPRTPEALAGDRPVRILALAGDARSEVARAPATVRIGRFDSVDVSMAPARRRRRFRARYGVRLHNGGNAPAVVGLAATDDADACRLRLADERIEVAAGATVATTLIARPRRPLLLGAPVEHRLALPVSAPGAPVVAPAMVFTQRAWLPRWLPVALPPVALVVAAALVLPARVPDVRGIPVEKAKRELDGSHLAWKPPELRRSAKAVGTVLDTIPRPGTLRLRGAQITLIVATNSRHARVPDVRGQR